MLATGFKTYCRLSTPRARLPLALAAALLLTVSITAVAFAASPASPPAAAPKAPALNTPLRQDGGWCTQYRLGRLTDETRVAEPNRRRLVAAQALLAPGFNPGEAVDGIRLIADYQAEMEARRPDRVLAATYLAVASAVPIDLPLIERVNRLLCVTASSTVAKGVAVIADAEWREMSR